MTVARAPFQRTGAWRFRVSPRDAYTMGSVVAGDTIGVYTSNSNTTGLRAATDAGVAAGTALAGLEDDSTVYVLRVNDGASLRSGEITAYSSTAGSQAVLDSSDSVRLASLLSFFQTQTIIILLGMLAVLLQQSVDILLVWPIEKLSSFDKPVLLDAISIMTRTNSADGGGVFGAQDLRWRRMLGGNDEEEMSTELMLAAVEVLRRDLSADARRNWARKAMMTQLQNADRVADSIQRSLLRLQQSDQLADNGGIRFQPVQNDDEVREAIKATKQSEEDGSGRASVGVSLRSRSSVVQYAGLESVAETGAKKQKTKTPLAGTALGVGEGTLQGVKEGGEGSESDSDEDEEEDNKEMDQDAEKRLTAMLNGVRAQAQEQASVLASTQS